MESTGIGIAPQTFIVKTISGLEQVLAEEIAGLGGSNVQILTRAVSFEGDKRLLYKANYCLRTGLRILVPLFDFQLADEDDLYNQINSYAWESLLNLQRTLAVDAVVSGSELTHSHYVALRTKDAIVDRFRTLNNGRRPNVDTENPDVRINIRIKGSICNVSIDSSGISLHKRGYRVSNAEAPISEVLAAGLILLSGWKGDSHFIDPMCGSGTLLIEAALYANNFPAGMYRKDFGFMHWPDYDADLFNEVVAEALDQQVEFEHQIIGSDISPKNLASAKANLKSARLHKDVKLSVSPFAAIKPPAGKPGVIIINPPYGERIRSNDIIGLYKSIGNTLKQEFAGYHAWIISSDQRALSFIGLRPSAKIPVFNGPLECRFEHFDLYRGSKRGRYIDNENSTDSRDYSIKEGKPNWRSKDAPAGEFDSLNPKPRESRHRNSDTFNRTGFAKPDGSGIVEETNFKENYPRKDRNQGESEYKSGKISPREYKPHDNNGSAESGFRKKNDSVRDDHNERKSAKSDRYLKNERTESRRVEKVKLRPPTRIEDRNEYLNPKKTFEETDNEPSAVDVTTPVGNIAKDDSPQRVPSKGNKFTEQRDAKLIYSRERRPRKSKPSDIEPEPPKENTTRKSSIPEEKASKNYINYDDLED